MKILEFFELLNCKFCQKVRNDSIPVLRMKYEVIPLDVDHDYIHESVRAWKSVCQGRVPAIRVVEDGRIEWIVGAGKIAEFARSIPSEIEVRVFPSMSVIG